MLSFLFVVTGQPVNGYRLFIQILAREYPQFVTNYLSTVRSVFIEDGIKNKTIVAWQFSPVYVLYRRDLVITNGVCM